MSYMGDRAVKLCEGIRDIIRKYDPEGKQGMSHAIDEYLVYWALQTAQELEEQIRED